MNKKKVFLIFIVCFGIFVVIEGMNHNIFMNENIEEYDVFSKEYLSANKHENFLPEFFSENTVGYSNSDGSRTLYVFSNPIAYFNKNLGWRFIKSDIVKNESESEYLYTVKENNIYPLYPKNIKNGISVNKINEDTFKIRFEEFGDAKVRLTSYINIIGEKVNVCQYSNKKTGENMYFYPNVNGTNCEICFGVKEEKKSFNFTIELDDQANEFIDIDEGGYISIYNKSLTECTSEIVPKAVIQKPIMIGENNEYEVCGKYLLEKINDYKYLVTFVAEENFENKKLFLSFDMYRECQNDNAIYSEKPNLMNAYLGNFYYLGYKEEYGIGKAMIKFGLIKRRKYELSEEDIINAKYYIRFLGNTKSEIVMNYVEEEWCSITGNWNSNYKFGKKIGKSRIKENVIECDITEAVKRWCVDNRENFGLVLSNKNEKTQNCLILSNDNTLYNNVTIIKLRS